MKQWITLTAVALLLACVGSSCKKNESLDWRALNVQWLEHNKAEKARTWFMKHYPDGTYDESNFHVTSSGLQYYVLYDGVPPHVNKSGYAYVFYRGSLITDRAFDSTGVTATQFTLSNLIEGMTEGLSKMNTKAEYVLFIPWNMGYGADGSGSVGATSYIPPYSTLIFQVQVDACGN